MANNDDIVQIIAEDEGVLLDELVELAIAIRNAGRSDMRKIQVAVVALDDWLDSHFEEEN